MEDINIQKFTNVSGDNLIVIPDTNEASNGDVLTYDSELSAVSWKPPQGGGTSYIAGTDISITDSTIGINTLGSTVGNYSFVEGGINIASGDFSHAEGGYNYNDTWAKIGTSAFADATHTEGIGTIANTSGMHAGGRFNKTSADALFVVGNGSIADGTGQWAITHSDAFVVDLNGNVSAGANIYTSAGQVVTDVMLTSAANSSVSFVTNGIADLTSLYTYIKSLEDRIAALEAAQGDDGFIVNGIHPTVNGNTITVGE